MTTCRKTAQERTEDGPGRAAVDCTMATTNDDDDDELKSCCSDYYYSV